MSFVLANFLSTELYIVDRESIFTEKVLEGFLLGSVYTELLGMSFWERISFSSFSRPLNLQQLS